MPGNQLTFGYIFQAGLYTKAAEIAFGGDWGFEFAVVEKQAPYIADILVADKEFLQEGRNQCLKAIELYKACMKTQVWPAPDVTIKKLSLPSGYQPVIAGRAYTCQKEPKPLSSDSKCHGAKSLNPLLSNLKWDSPNF